MAPKAGKAKPHKAKGEKKKKDEKGPTGLFFWTICLHPSRLGISTDRILDVRKLLAVHVETCHLTNFSLSHEVRGTKLKDTADIISLKPATHHLPRYDYTEELAVAHVRRLLDIRRLHHFFGPSFVFFFFFFFPKTNGRSVKTVPPATPGLWDCNDDGFFLRWEGEEESSRRRRRRADKNAVAKGPRRRARRATSLSAPASSRPVLRLLLVLAPLPSVKYIRKSSRPFWRTRRRMISSRLMKGFYPSGKRNHLSHTLVGLLQQNSRVFDAAYKALMKAFTEHNKFGNLPYGFRANTWVVPPLVADNPSVFPALPMGRRKLGVGIGVAMGETGDTMEGSGQKNFLFWQQCRVKLQKRGKYVIAKVFCCTAYLSIFQSLRQLLQSST
ncbi:hypothetical protein MLD38_014929 [Melastoma candidum]|uniref:Uncharacterized protein n=1 Tax=Melastoma candidum TaxID=119954 RepID=A0ACB9RI29_9MYRT|nr:hypothetical protein MLD38_014929 [Melastoma candidum]